jgi:tRNA pseudouridine38-40 synthase
MHNVALCLAYDGTHFAGSQWQRNQRTVQGVVESAWQQLTQEQTRFVFSGRTDAGVHAQRQVVNVHTSTHHSITTIQRALNALLPNDVVISDCWHEHTDFHARFDAQWRWYRYLIDTHTVLQPQLRLYVLHTRTPLDIAAMQEAVVALEGQHYFTAFTTYRAAQAATTKRHCFHVRCHDVNWFGHSLIAVDIIANAFLQHMVRMIVGTLLRIGRGAAPPALIATLLETQDRAGAGPTAAPQGLSLMDVGYSPCALGNA